MEAPDLRLLVALAWIGIVTIAAVFLVGLAWLVLWVSRAVL